VRTDHNNLKYFLEQKDLSKRQQKWVSKLQAYDLDIEYVKGKKNVVVDALSRRPSVFSLTEVSTDWKSSLLVEYSKNTFSCELMEGTIQDDRYRVVDDIIYYKERIYLVPESTLKDKILRAVHDAPLAGHPGYLKTYRQVRERFSWKGLKEDVLWYVRECKTCQQNKSEMTHPTGLLQPLPIPERKWESISMDFITGLPKVQGRDCIYVVVDRLTKYAHLFSIPSESNASQVADLFFREVFRLHGLPRNIVSDRDSRFLNAFWQELFRLSGMELTPSTSYHPQTDEQTEIVNKWVEGYLRNYVSGQQRAWIKWLHLGEHCYNTTHHMSIGMSLFRALYGYDAPSFVDLEFGERKGPQGQRLVVGKSGHPEGPKGEFTGYSEPTKYVCR
jgi:transposase InsO family protein